MKDFKGKKIRYIKVDEMNERLKYCKKWKNLRYNEEIGHISVLNAYIEDKMVWFHLTYDDGTGPCTYSLRKDVTELGHSINGLQAFTTMSKYWQPPKRDAPFSAKPFLWFKPSLSGTRNKCWGYDLNSAYASAMIDDDFPDTSKTPRCKEVEEGEIGFDADGTITRKGYAMYVFKTMPSPLKGFIEHYYKVKRNTNDPVEKQKAKDMMNMAVGFLQLRNPWIRSYIVGKCTERIVSLIDCNTVYCNTDSLVSLKPRDDLKIGKELGEWKLEHTGEFAYREFNYQWDKKPPSYRGIPKSWFKKGFDILTDSLPICGNVYEYDINKNKIIRRRKYVKE